MPGALRRREGVPLLVAEAPPRGAAPGHRALNGDAGVRLARYCGMSLNAFFDAYDTVNLVGRWPGAAVGKGTRWDAAAARRAAARLPLRGVTVLLGERVRRAYRLSTGLEWGMWLHDPRRGWVTVIPHPSGLNLLYNDQRMQALAASVLVDARLLARGALVTPNMKGA